MPDHLDLHTSLVRVMATKPLPIIRQTAVDVINLLSKPNSTIETISRTILHDQAFTARVLKIANSAYYRRDNEKITNVIQAMLRMGYNTVREMAIAAEFAELVQRRLPSGVNLRRLLAKAVVAAHQALVLGQVMRLPDIDTLFIRALLESLGELATAVYMPQVYLKIDSAIKAEGLPHDTAHLQVTGMTSHAATEIAFKALELPEELLLFPPDWEQKPEWTATDMSPAVVHLMNTCASNIFGPESARTTAQFETIRRQAISLTGFPPDEMDKLLSQAYNEALDFGNDVDLDRSCFALEGTDEPLTPRQIFIATCLELADFTITVKQIWQSH